jgi:hypothetical protein
VLHAGLLTPDSTQRVFTAFLPAANHLLEQLPTPKPTFGTHTVKLIDQLVTDKLTEIEHSVAMEARCGQGGLYGSHDQNSKRAAASLAAARQAVTVLVMSRREREEEMRCPACGDEEARCIGVAEAEWDVDWEVEHGERTPTVHGVVLFYPNRFVCSVCELDCTEPTSLSPLELNARGRSTKTLPTTPRLADYPAPGYSSRDDDYPAIAYGKVDHPAYNYANVGYPAVKLSRGGLPGSGLCNRVPSRRWT